MSLEYVACNNMAVLDDLFIFCIDSIYCTERLSIYFQQGPYVTLNWIKNDIYKFTPSEFIDIFPQPTSDDQYFPGLQ